MNDAAIHRKSYMEIGEIFFFTATIHKWYRLLQPDQYKEIIVSSLAHLSNIGKLDVFAFVIMPNHIHLIWRTNSLNGKETVQGSFLKYTAHEFRKRLLKDSPSQLEHYRVQATNKDYEFWQRDSLAVHLYTRDVTYQKLEYLHLNPLAEHWQLVKDPSDYFYSTASFYEKEIIRFPFINDLRLEF
jgi:REP element-mobilizing transposase RayT